MLKADEPHPVRVHGGRPDCPFVMASEHASCRVPRELNNLGLSKDDLSGHIGWDRGAEEVGRTVAGSLGAIYLCQAYSRLVIDCNRPPDGARAILPVSDEIPIPGNAAIGVEDRARRRAAIFDPFHDRIDSELEDRQARLGEAVLVTVHSFAPSLADGAPRPWNIGFLYNRDDRLARRLIDITRARHPDLCVGDNIPYPIDDDNHFTIPRHGEDRGIPHVMIEMRQDQLGTPSDRAMWGERLADLLREAVGMGGVA